ncbi:metallophosphoesterase family protein [uncultured Thiodictyon sp.]|uniref:metallophosphoesterase family protein n=1 Tax=uncultured Thiodictyon sp. TaxID=1846217 RepID=UPI0025DE4F42|nr:metallophosphoesterase family protein [uncultured Thiodictyon sp.]
MKMALISDIHGNYPALLAVLGRIREENCDLIVSLGDVAGYYCMINECIDLCRKRSVVNILGNHDHYLAFGGECPRSTTVNMCINFQRRVISPENLRWLRESIREYRTRHCWFVHGGWNDPLDEYVNAFDFLRFSTCGAQVFASGHTHIQKIERKAPLTYVNPGSVGQPRDGNPGAAFAVIDSASVVSLCRVDYDIDGIASAMKRNGFERRFYEGLYDGTRIQQFDRTQSP